MARAVVPGMVVRKRGHVVTLGSMAGEIVYPNGAVYCGTKAAARAINDGLREDLLGTPVRVTSVDPGLVETDFSLVRFHGDAGRAAKVYKGIDAADRRRHCGCDSVGRDAACACEYCARLAYLSESGQYAAHPSESNRAWDHGGSACVPHDLRISGCTRSLSPMDWICDSIWANAASRAARRPAFDVFCERIFSRCKLSACSCRSRAAR